MVNDVTSILDQKLSGGLSLLMSTEAWFRTRVGLFACLGIDGKNLVSTDAHASWLQNTHLYTAMYFFLKQIFYYIFTFKQNSNMGEGGWGGEGEKGKKGGEWG